VESGSDKAAKFSFLPRIPGHLTRTRTGRTSGSELSLDKPEPVRRYLPARQRAWTRDQLRGSNQLAGSLCSHLTTSAASAMR
jgi:hypothetical protein